MIPIKRILCVDIGATRIKWGVLQTPLVLNEIRSVVPASIVSQGWLNSHLPELFDPRRSTISVAEHDGLAISICGQVLNEGRTVKGWLNKHGLPEDLKARLEQVTGKPVWMANDALAWLRGAVRGCRLAGIEFQQPAFVFTFGTGVGIARLTSKGEFQPLEFENWFKGRRVAKAAGWNATFFLPWKVHELVGHEFFEWVRSSHLEWSEQTIQSEFSKRAAAIVRDVCMDRQGLETPPQTIFVGGGHTRYLLPGAIQERCKLNVIQLESVLAGCSPDLLPLLGCLPPELA